MKLLSTNITSLYRSQIKVLHRDEPHFNRQFHCHPEYELVYIIEGFGKRIIGNKVEEFDRDEMLLLGPNVPHLWVSDPSFHSPVSVKRSRSLVVYFNAEIFSDSFYSMEESHALKQLFEESKKGIKIVGSLKSQVLAKLEKLQAAKDLEKIICLLDILNTITNSDELVFVNEEAIANQAGKAGRLNELFNYINSNYRETITLKKAAEITNLTPESFCRYFKQKTGKNFIEYLQETRVSHACQTLLNTDFTVAEIAYQTGFKTASNFNKLFKKLTGDNPTAYRKKLV